MTNLPPETASAPSAPGAPSAVLADLQAQLGALHEQVQKLQVDNSTLQSKLHEALGVQPAAVDPRELAKAQERIRSLMKENDLLKVSLSQGKTGPAPGAATAESAALQQAQQALAEANLKLTEQTERANRLARENQALQTRVQTLLSSPGAIQALREENEVLKKQIADLKTAASCRRSRAAENRTGRDAQPDRRVAVGGAGRFPGKVSPRKPRAPVAGRGGQFRTSFGARPGGK